jgi:pimeloyl-ACP methyl ester carboxylesterase
MAEDVIALLNHVGWTAKRELHVVGISLGGMIAQGIFLYYVGRLTISFLSELAYRIPDRIASLVLAVTTPGGSWWNNFPPVRVVHARLHISI